MSSNIRVTSCTIADAPAIARNNIPAFWTDSTWVLMWRGKTCEYVTEQAVLRMPATLLKDPANVRHQKAVDERSGKVVGYVRWVLPAVAEVEVEAESRWAAARVPAVDAAKLREVEQERSQADWEYDHALDELDERMLEMKRSLMDGKRYIVLDYLAVHPDDRGQGIGTMLVKKGIEEARKMNLDVFVHGMEAGLGVYERAGFKLLDQMILDDSPYGGKGTYGSYFLVKEAKGGKFVTEEDEKIIDSGLAEKRHKFKLMPDGLMPKEQQIQPKE